MRNELKIGQKVKVEGKRNPITIIYSGRITSTAKGLKGAEITITRNNHDGKYYTGNFQEVAIL